MLEYFPVAETDDYIEGEASGLTPPVKDTILQTGQTIYYIKKPAEKPSWYAIRATQKRAQKVYNSLAALKDDSLDLYLPLLKQVVYSNEDFDNPTKRWNYHAHPLGRWRLARRCVASESSGTLQLFPCDGQDARRPSGITPTGKMPVAPVDSLAILINPAH